MPSTAIRRYLYHPAQATLDVEFVSGRVYRYARVPEGVARGLAGARSKGGYLNRAIRDRFACAELTGWDEPGDAAQPSPACDTG